MGAKKYNKLVRDKIPEIIFSQGQRAKVAIANAVEYRKLLKDKLQEEVNEYLENPCVQELADIQEVIFAIASDCGWDEMLEEERVAKNMNRGTFSRKYILIEVQD